ncbi:hypothetical protein PAL_GLEAN10023270 [Pteropus alecto]|uniref:Uncharacterized protein n=1 Tax=Pteropus alecto TaxID=9402 RepID=L5K0X9_PTEAL|nr:hypothetical protein PAL_GLEAN10023270 [Pteropus alecto]
MEGHGSKRPELDDRRTIYVMSHWLEVSSKGLFKEVLETQSLCYAPKAILETPEESTTSGNQHGNSENSYEPPRGYK